MERERHKSSLKLPRRLVYPPPLLIGPLLSSSLQKVFHLVGQDERLSKSWRRGAQILLFDGTSKTVVTV